MDYEFECRGKIRGIRHYSKAGDVNDVAAIIGVIATGTEIVVSGKPEKGKWHKVIDRGDGKEGGYVLLSGKEKFTVRPEFTTDEIVGCDIAVKAGTVIGKAGDFGHEINGKYKDPCHFEIFTGDDVEAFLNNTSKKRIVYLKIVGSNEFTADFEIKTLPKGYPVEIIEKRGSYSKIKIPRLIKTVPYSALGIYSKDSNSYALKGETNESYIKRKASSKGVENEDKEIPQANLPELQKIFGDFLTAEDRLHFNSKTETEREVYFDHPLTGETVWIRTDWTEEPMAIERLKGIESIKVTTSEGQPKRPSLANLIID